MRIFWFNLCVITALCAASLKSALATVGVRKMGQRIAGIEENERFYPMVNREVTLNVLTYISTLTNFCLFCKLKVMKNLTYSLYSLPNTVFSTKEIALILGEADSNLVKSKISYYVKKDVLVRLRKGVYAKRSGYEILEAANKIFTPSYISLETVLQKEGVVFQDYGSVIFVVSYQTREVRLGDYDVHFKKIKNEILTNPEGIDIKNGYSIASKERAFMDAIYLYKNYYFDNLDSLDWEKAKRLLPVYSSKTMEERFKSYVRDFHS